MMQEELDKLENFFLKYRRITYKKRDVITRADDIPSGVYFIHKGYARLYTLSETGQELSLIIYRARDFFPMFWAINDSPNTQYVEAITTLEVSRAPKTDFLEFLDNNPDIIKVVLRRVLMRFEGIVERMEYMVFGNAYEKVASILVICAERFGREKDGVITVRVPLTHRDIANLVGLTRETASVEIKKLEKKGVCEKDGSYFTVKNLNKLKTEAQWNKFV